MLTALLRVIHIGAGVAWVGSLFMFVFFIEPTSRTLGPAAAPFMQELIGKRKVIRTILWSGTITIAAGLVLYVRDLQAVGSSSVFLGTRFGLSLTLGGIAAIIAFGIGMFGTRPAVSELMALGREVAASGAPPEADVAAKIGALQARLRILARTGLALLTLAVIGMAAARYA